MYFWCDAGLFQMGHILNMRLRNNYATIIIIISIIIIYIIIIIVCRMSVNIFSDNQPSPFEQNY